MVRVELDSFYVKFKHLLHAEKDATLTLKSEAGRAFVTLSLDLGHVHSGQGEVPREPRNGPSRQRRREKREAARAAEKKAAENSGTLPAVEADKELEPEENVEETSPVEKSDAEEAPELEAKLTTEKATETTEEVIIPLIDDEFCPDTTYRNEPKNMKSMETQTIETSCSCGAAAVPERKLAGFDYFSMWPSDYD